MKLGLFYFGPKTKYEFNSSYFPNNLGYIASYLEKYGGFEETFIEADFEKLLQKKPDVIGLSSYTETFNQAKEYARLVKERLNIPVIIGGHHISNLPHNLTKDMDLAVIGEGEQTMLELLNLLKEKDLSPEKLRKIDGIAFHGEDGIELTRTRAAISPLDTIPFPKRSLGKEISIPIKQYNIMTSRGCPFTCIYCTAGLAIEKNRYHSVERVIAELHFLMANYANQEFISISDDLFAVNKKRLRQLRDAIRSEGLHKKVPFGCNARASVFDEEIARLLCDMNIKFLTFGLESGNDRMLKYLKGAASLKKNQEAMDICKKYNLSTYTHFIIGSPTEKLEETADTYWFIRRNSDKIASANAMFSTPLPGTQFWKIAVNEKLIAHDFEDWDAMNLWFTPGKSVYLNKEYSAEIMHTEVIPRFREIVTGKHPPYHSRDYYSHITVKPGSSVLEFTNSIDNFSDYRNFEKYVNIKIQYGKAALEELNEKKFDLILFSDCLNNFYDYQQILEVVKTYLNPDGQVVIIFDNPNFVNALLKIIYTFELEYKVKVSDNDALHFLTLDTIRKTLEKLSYKVEMVIPVIHNDIQVSEVKKLLSPWIPSDKLGEANVMRYCLSAGV